MPTVQSEQSARPSAVELAKSTLIGIGGLSTTAPPEKLRTVLGSCVGIVVYDPTARILGLAHSILPTGSEVAAEPGKFADQAVDNLVAQLIASGARKTRLLAKLAGCAAMFGGGGPNSLGDRNAAAARSRLQHLGIPIMAESLGGTKGRKLLADPLTGQVTVEVIGEAAVVM